MKKYLMFVLLLCNSMCVFSQESFSEKEAEEHSDLYSGPRTGREGNLSAYSAERLKALKEIQNGGNSNGYRSANYSADWELIGPVSLPSQDLGLVSCIDVHPENPNRVLLGTVSGGVWKSTNALSGSPTWTCLTNDYEVPSNGVRAVATHPSQPNTILIATTDDFHGGSLGNEFSYGVYKSTDGGATWFTTSLDFDPVEINGNWSRTSEVTFAPNNPNRAYALFNNKLYYSNDAGEYWTEVSMPGVQANQIFDEITFHPSNPNVFYISSIGAYSWWMQLNPNPQAYKVDFSGSTPLVTDITPHSTVLDETIYKRERVDVAPRIGSGGGLELAVIVSYAGPANVCKIYSSTNNGNSYSENNTSFNSTINGGSTPNWWMGDMVASKLSNKLYIGTTGMYQSLNDGQNFSLIQNHYNPYSAYSGNLHVDIRDIVHFIDPSDATKEFFFIATDGGISYAINPNTPADYVNINGTGLAISQFHKFDDSDLNPNFLSGGVMHNSILTTKASVAYHSARGDGYSALYSKKNPNNVIGQGNTYLFKSVNGGETFTYGSTPGSSGYYPWPALAIDDKYYLATSGIYRIKEDLTGGWTTITSFSGSVFNGRKARAFQIAQSDPNVAYLSMDDVNVNGEYVFFRTNNFTSATPTWTNLSSNVHLSGGGDLLFWRKMMDIAIDPKNANRIWAIIEGLGTNRVLRSQDGGVTWTDFSQGLSQLPVNCIIYEKGTNDGMYIGTDVGVYYRNAGMSYWELFNEGLPKCIVTDLKINYGINKLRAASHGRGLWQTPLACPINTNLTYTSHPIDVFAEAGNNITSTANIISTRKIEYRAGKRITLSNGFRANQNSKFWAFIHPCDDVNIPSSYSYKMEEYLGIQNLQESFSDNYEAEKKIEEEIEEEGVSIFPNPSAGVFDLYISDDFMGANYSLTDVTGKILLKGIIYKKTQGFNVELPQGIYLINLVKGDKTTTLKFVIR